VLAGCLRARGVLREVLNVFTSGFVRARMIRGPFEHVRDTGE
jgi:hypothetical protein